MRRLRRAWWLLVLLGMAACTAPPASTLPPAPAEQAAVVAPTDAPTEEPVSALTDVPAAEPVEEVAASTTPEPVAEEQTAEPTTHPDRPSGPSPENADFRSDPPTVYAATGNPQLLEFFTFW